VIEQVELAISGRAAAFETQQLGALANAPVWEEVEARIRADATSSPSFYLFLIIAGIIRAVGILTNFQILIVAAMADGPVTNLIDTPNIYSLVVAVWPASSGSSRSPTRGPAPCSGCSSR
jgi:hypothetical protein